MHAIILAGGKGTRLRPLTVHTPKPIVPLVNKPFLAYQVEILRRAGVSDITLSLNYQPDKIEAAMGDGSDVGVNIRYIVEPSPLGTGGAFRYAAEGSSETTIVFNGDILTNIDIAAVIAHHKSKRAAATLALMPVADPSAYGLVETNSDDGIERFLEKPKPEELAGSSVNTINAGIYLLEPSIIDLMPYNENRSFEYDVFPEIRRREMPFFAYKMSDEYWRDIGSPASYLQANADILNGTAKGFEKISGSRSDDVEGSEIDAFSRIGSDAVIKSGARITNSVIGRGAVIGEKAIVENSVIWPFTRVGASAVITNAIIGRNCQIGKNTEVSQGAVLGDMTQLTDFTKV